MKRCVLSLLLMTIAASAGSQAGNGWDPPVQSFRPISTFLVPNRNSAEIVSATPDGKTLVYTDAVGSSVGIVDITNPAAPVQTATVAIDGQPTSVAVTPDGRRAVVAVRKAAFAEGDVFPQPFAPVAPGELWMIDLANPSAAPAIFVLPAGPGGAVPYLPDSVALATIRGRLYAVVAIENEPIVLRKDGADFRYLAPEPAGLPSCPATAAFEFDGDAFEGCDRSDPGFVQIVRVRSSGAPGFEAVSAVAVPDEPGMLFGNDPQPEYVSIHDEVAAVTLQENNAVAIIGLSRPASPSISIFSAGSVDDRRADLIEDAAIDFSQTYPSDVASVPFAGMRFPDGVAWSRSGHQLFTADEGEFDFTGGRGWSGWTPHGALRWDDGGRLEKTAVTRGYYPDGRSANKGIEVEGIATAVFDRNEFVFVTSERGSFLAVYELEHGEPRFVQLLPTGIAPESVLPIPQRNLIVTANEGDAGDGTISIFQGVPRRWNGTPDRPLLESTGVRDPWSAVSGFAPDHFENDRLYAVPDDAMPSAVYRIDVNGDRARIGTLVPITKAGGQGRYDLEGIVVDTSIASRRSDAGGRGFWLAAEGNAICDAGEFKPNLLIQVNARGAVAREVRLPAALDPDAPCASRPPGTITSNGFEGVTLSSNGRYLLAAIQRPFSGEAPAGGARFTRIARYDLQTSAWDFFAYPLQVSASDTIGLSEISFVGRKSSGQDVFGVIERDNRYGERAKFKRVYTFSLPGASCGAATTVDACAGSGALITKTLFEDVADEFFPLEKVESLAWTRSGDVWMALDNDGGEIEPRMVRIRAGRGSHRD